MVTNDVKSTIALPDAPQDQQDILACGGVACWSEPVLIDTYAPGQPDRYPLFLDRRVYQGSSGKVYPVPFIDSIGAEKEPRLWQAIHLENEYVRLMLLPEIGGRIHIGYDKTAGYDFFYRNNVIKPGLVGLAGPWISGGVEFNWPQHHRPATFLPVDTAVERSGNGSVTVWHSDLDPLQRMRGTHGVRLIPGSSLIEVEARLHNRTDEPQTFLWWANVAARVHDKYQSFFPTDVTHVADHARRAVTTFPRADRPYYGVDYPALAASGAGDADRSDADRLDFYANIPVPTSYMVTDTKDSFFGGYDHAAGAGFVHWADRSIAPGKKQWTWGTGPMGTAWDRHLTDDDGPYVELMAGVFTDNQPDFSYLAPGETRTFSQYWYPIRQMGPAQQANLDAAVALSLDDAGRTVTVGVSATARRDARIELRLGEATLHTWAAVLSPAHPFTATLHLPVPAAGTDLTLRVLDGDTEVISWTPRHPAENPEPWAATEPAQPQDMDSMDELFVTGTHLTQNRHPTRSPLPYFEEMLCRDPLDSRASTALAAARYRSGHYAQARDLLENALARLTRRNLNPPSGEASYRLGLVLERTGHLEEARERFGKAAWDRAWAHPAHLALARLALRSGDAAEALRRAALALATEATSPEAGHLSYLALERLGRRTESTALLADILAADPLDPVAQALAGTLQVADPKTGLVVACWLARAGQWERALDLTRSAEPADAHPAFGNPGPLRHYLRAGWLEEMLDPEAAAAERARARRADSTYAFPYGLDDFDALHRALEADPKDRVAHGLLGCWLLDAGRTTDALAYLEKAMAYGSQDPVVWRNAALATVNTGGDPGTADRYFRRALELAPGDARLVFERAVLAEVRGLPAGERIAAIEQHGPAVLDRDDLAILYANLLTDAGRAEDALALLASRSFQPFEGGEGLALAAYDRAAVRHARVLMAEGPTAAAALLRDGIEAPANLGEGRHPADSMAERFVALGDALDLAGDAAAAAEAWNRALLAGGPLAVDRRPAGSADYWRGIAFVRLGLPDGGEDVWRQLEARADELDSAPAAPDYFATSLPELLLFNTDTAASRGAAAAHLRQLAGQGRLLAAHAGTKEGAAL
ncbi:tetratricopeptide (TPR) repeat protein [Arthrobacter sp. SORGH_AS 212]|nr:tetratricopeptide (TPR) repeat protein [Arthrobacter sp. SORGH_AS_0212]